MRVMWLSIGLLLCGLLMACSNDTSGPSPTPAPATPPLGTPVTIPMGASTLGDRAFSPGQVSVDAGATVTWVNSDTVAHTSTADGNGWSSGALAPGQQFSTTFTTPGTFRYHCAIHPGMVGSVVVK
jgi:plastocyanin